MVKFDKIFPVGMSAGEDSSSSNSKRESPCSSGQSDAEQTKLAGIAG